MFLVHRRLGPKSDIEKTARIISSAQRTLAPVLCGFPFLQISCKMDIAPISSSTICKRKENPIRSAKHRGAQSKKWSTLNQTNKTRHSEQFNDIVLEVFQKKEQSTAFDEYVSCLRVNKQKRSRIEIHDTS